MFHIKLAVKMFKTSSCTGARVFHQGLANKTITPGLTDGMRPGPIKVSAVNSMTSANQLESLSSIYHATRSVVVEQLDLAGANQKVFL
jgi:hypothetical protein